MVTNKQRLPALLTALRPPNPLPLPPLYTPLNPPPLLLMQLLRLLIDPLYLLRRREPNIPIPRGRLRSLPLCPMTRYGFLVRRDTTGVMVRGSRDGDVMRGRRGGRDE